MSEPRPLAMLSDAEPLSSKRKARFWLTLRVHLDAVIGAPLRYAEAVWWRLQGKRVRARSRIAPLLGTSESAYSLWLARKAAAPPASRSGCETADRWPIVAVVDASDGAGVLEDTLRSLEAEGIGAVVVGSDGGCSPRCDPVVASLAEAAEMIDWQERPWLMAISAGDTVEPGTVLHYQTALAAAPARVAYADDDLLNAGQRHAPHFKPDWNSELFRHFDFLSGACLIQVSKAAMLAAANTPDWRRHLIASAIKTEAPVHVHQVLHHRLARPAPTVPKPAAQAIDPQPPVTVIVPTRNGLDLLRTCFRGLDATKYRDFNVIVVDNGSDDRDTLAFLSSLDPQRFSVLRDDGPFNFAALNNRAVQRTQSPMLCLLNNDIEVIEPIWLSTMVRQAMRDDVGAVGAQLHYPDGRIQHAGVVLGVGGGAAHAHRFLHPAEEGYFQRHQLPQYVSAVTAACLVVQRDRFLEAGGLDEKNFAVAFNDVDLCMRLNQLGWQSFYEPRARLVHHESVSRGWDRDPVGARRFAGELAVLKRKWGTDVVVDPYHHPSLSRFSERFVIAL